MRDVQQGTRFVWNCTPKSKVLLGKSSIHPAVHYTPLEEDEVYSLTYNPLSCTCGAIMNGYCPIDYASKTIRCCLCNTSERMPANYAQNIKPDNLPFELGTSEASYEFKSPAPKNVQYRTSYIFVVDLCVNEKELNSVKETLAQVVRHLPDNTNVGLLTYFRHVNVHQLSSRINTVACINGEKDYQPVQLMRMIGLDYGNQPNLEVTKKFIVPVDQYREVIVSRVLHLRTDRFIYVNQRNHCSFGQALHMAVTLCEGLPITARIVLLAGGPCTYGPGVTISPDFKQQMRSAEELSRGENLPHFASAKQYYDGLLKRVISRKIVIDLFAFSLNEIGFTEMSDLIIDSGGYVVMHEEFSDRIFKESFGKIFRDNTGILEGKIINYLQASMLVFCSREITINGALGQCHSLNVTKPFVSDKLIGKGGTCSWHLGSVDRQKTVTIFYECKEQEAKEEYFYLQFKLLYRNNEGEFVTRVKTIRRRWSGMVEEIANGFDSEAAIVSLGRLAVNKILYEEQKNVRQWLDQCLCRWAQVYSNFIVNDPSSFCLPQPMKTLPQLMFHLRRSHFVNRFGISLDESFYIGYNLNRESVDNCLAMIRPVLLSFSLDDSQPKTVQLDEEEMRDDVILLLDAYFVVIEWHSTNVHGWVENKYHQMEEYRHIADLLQAPKQDIDYMMLMRFPVPNYYLVHPYHSKERYLKSRVNPRKGEAHENMVTDDSNLLGFTQHLMQIVTKPT